MDYVDANVFWSWLKGNLCQEFFVEVARGERSACTSFYVLIEMRTAMLGKGYGSSDVKRSLEAVLNLPNLGFVEIDSDVFAKALGLDSGEQELGIFDAIHAAICLKNGFRLATFDKGLSKISGLKTVAPS